ncbi:D-tyrosyl-tRNA(Tyr) deacylase [Salana multivorans]|uniref:D-aminoacyl-tRNA deacylase n=1 Tax=Salana multivorans TaxID=120377 RepID=A0A3N2DBZ9_9MICO|nr:D-aminoacyl-tRNA deacylase [Salana multivorans]OJX97696.1 MAG: D-tyrosyl-tRNA(Tyr) deacylase [Micrococcales bacterium 73-15]ROR97273.1 D-tyrosyl-tRNA(Tyr) deacylase [Salana multivorans]
MRAVLQRVTRADVVVDGEVVGAIGDDTGELPGILALVGVTHDDGPAAAATIARKIADLRIMRGERSVAELAAAGEGGEVLVVSQFTLYGDARKGRRPTWVAAAPGEVAEPLVAAVVDELRSRGLTVATGVFGADMAVSLVNDGPVTLVLDV